MPLSLNSGNGLLNRTIKFSQVKRSKVSESIVFAISPDLFGRIKLKRILGKPFHLDRLRMSLPIVLKQSCPVDTPSIQNKGDLKRDTLSEFPQERENIFGKDVVLRDTPVKIEPAFCWRKADGADNQEMLVRDVFVKDRGFSFRRPGAAKKGLKHKTRFIEEDNCSAFSFGVFLYVAIFLAARIKSPLRFVLGGNVGVSDNPTQGV